MLILIMLKFNKIIIALLLGQLSYGMEYRMEDSSEIFFNNQNLSENEKNVMKKLLYKGFLEINKTNEIECSSKYFEIQKYILNLNTSRNPRLPDEDLTREIFRVSESLGKKIMIIILFCEKDNIDIDIKFFRNNWDILTLPEDEINIYDKYIKDFIEKTKNDNNFNEHILHFIQQSYLQDLLEIHFPHHHLRIFKNIRESYFTENTMHIKIIVMPLIQKLIEYQINPLDSIINFTLTNNLDDKNNENLLMGFIEFVKIININQCCNFNILFNQNNLFNIDSNFFLIEKYYHNAKKVIIFKNILILNYYQIPYDNNSEDLLTNELLIKNFTLLIKNKIEINYFLLIDVDLETKISICKSHNLQLNMKFLQWGISVFENL